MATLQVGSRGADRDPARPVGSWFGRLRHSRPLQAVLVLGSVVFALVITGTILLLQELRAREIAEAKRGLSNLNAVLAESTGRALQSVDLVIRSVVDELKPEMLASPDELRRHKADLATHQALKAKISGLPQLDAISIVAVNGRMVNFSRTFPLPDISISDRDHFTALRDRAAPEPYVSPPIQALATGDWAVYVGRRLLRPDGSFAGAVFAALNLRYFEDFSSSLDLNRDSSISLWRLDGTLLTRFPSTFKIGQRYESPAFRGLDPQSPPLVYDTPAGLDGQARVVARRVVSGFPLAVATSRTVKDSLTEWRRQTVVFGVAGAVVAAAVLAVMIALARQFAAYEEMSRALRDTEAAVQGRTEAEAQLRQSQKLEVMGQLTSGVAHDFNNLLTVVIGNLDILARRLPPELAKLRRHVEGARGGADRAAALTRRLLAFSRRQALEPTILDLNELVRSMSDLLRQTLGENMNLVLDLVPDLSPTFADPGQLDAALLNLVVNARDAMPGGGTVTVSTRNEGGRPDAGFVLLTVADTGIGMSPEVMRRAFEPFFTTKDAGVGTGLGLAQVYGFVKQSSGDVAIDSQEGAGTRITLRLPRFAGTEAARTPSTAEVARRRPAGELVLVVDDHLEVRRTSADALAGEGFHVLEAEDANSALRLLAVEPVAVLFADIGLPGMDGRALAKAAIRLRPDLRVLLTTGHAIQDGDPGASNESHGPVLKKPFTSADLASHILDLLDRAPPVRETPRRLGSSA